MTIFELGPEMVEPGQADLPDGSPWLVYWYRSGDYDGDGQAVASLPDGHLVEASLGHCSCYGPWEGGWSGEKVRWSKPVSVEAWLENNPVSDNVCDDQDNDKLVRQVRKLVGG